MKFNTSIAQDKLPQLIVADFLETGQYERHLRKLRMALKNQVSNSAQAIARLFPQGTKLTAPTGGYVLWVELAENVDGVELFRLAKAENILIIPGAITTGTGRFKNCIRISCGTPWSGQMEDGMRRLGVLVSRLHAK